MINILEDNRNGVIHFSITSELDIEQLPKRGIRTGSSATLYLPDGSIQIWNFIASENFSIGGNWILMI